MMAKRLWLIFAQAVTVFLAGYFVISTLKPDWLGSSNKVQTLTVKEASQALRNFLPVHIMMLLASLCRQLLMCLVVKMKKLP